jgi:TolA-binding protein
MAQFRSIMEKYPRSEFAARSEYQIGIMQYDRLADLDGALASFEHVLAQTAQTNVFRFDVELMIGRLHITRGDTVRAVIRFADVAAAPGALPDQSDEAAFHLAEIDYFGGRFGDAAKRLEGIVVNLKADYANDALRFQSFLQENIKVAPEALREYARADFLARQGKKTEAVALMRDVVARYPRTPLVDDALMCIGGLQFSAGFYADAVATYERLLTDFRENSILLDRAQFQLAETFEAGMRDTPKAVAAYEKLLADYPSSVLADEARRRIRRL